MPRQPSAEIALRNKQVYAEWKDGRSLAWLADKYERTPQQMGRIVAGFHPEIEDDDARALHRGRLEALYEEVSAVAAEPGWKMAPNGRLALDEDDQPIVDIAARIEALKLKLMVLESERKLDARDRPQQRHLLMTHEVASQQKDTALEEIRRKIAADAEERRRLEDLARRASVVQGEIIRELPAAGS